MKDQNRKRSRGLYSVCGHLLLLLFISCSRGNSSPSGNPDHDFVAQAGSAVDINGRWLSACNEGYELGLGERSTITFDDIGVVREIEISPRGDCSSPYIQMRVSGQFLLGREFVPGVIALDIQSSSAKIQPLTEQAARILKLARTCGITNWKAGETKDVSARVGRENCLRRFPAQQFTIFSIDGNKMYFGDGEAAAVLRARPLSVDKIDFYVRE